MCVMCDIWGLNYLYKLNYPIITNCFIFALLDNLIYINNFYNC